MVVFHRLINVFVWIQLVYVLYGFEFILDSRLDGKMCLSVFTIQTTSLVACTVICKQEPACKSQFYTRLTSTCTGCVDAYYDPDESSLTIGEGTVYFRTQYASYGEKCHDVHRPCSEENSVCVPGLEKCLCNLKTSVYSQSIGSCVTECAQFGTTYAEHPEYGLGGYNIGGWRKLSIYQCKAICSGTYNTSCFSIDYRTSDGYCMLNHEVSYNAQSDVLYPTVYTMYARNCL